MQTYYEESSPGVFIDIDGVVLQGGKPFEWSRQAIHALWSNEVPFVFVTNGTYSSANLVNSLTDILGLPFTNDHVVVAPSPCSALYECHDKHVLVCCQEDSIDLIKELGFTSYMTIPELVEVFPELDYVDHNKRKELLKNPLTPERQRRIDEFKPVEAILLLGEPVNWECALQIILDVLMTNGDLRNKFKFVPSPHLPIIACNKDLTFKGAAALPRFGHGAFLECLEALYMKVTRNELVYDKLMGKPYLITYEFAANQIQRLAKHGRRINKFYIIGDNPDVDVRGANYFKEHLISLETRNARRNSLYEIDLKSTSKVESILVCTGVYNPQSDLMFHLRTLFDENNKVSDVNNNAPSEEKKGFYSNASSCGSMDKLRAEKPLNEVEKRELCDALSRKNSFISYFDNKYNIPDITVDNILEGVNYIIRKKVLEQI